MERNRRSFLAACATAAGVAALAPSIRNALAAQEPRWPRYRTSIVIDACGIPGGMHDGDVPGLTAGEVADLRAGGMTAINLTVSGSIGNYATDFEATLRDIAFWDAQIAAHADVLMKLVRGAQVDEAKKAGRVGIFYGVQDTTAYGENFERFDLFRNLGLRIVQLTYNRRNLVGDGCLEPGNAGLSRFGMEFVERLNAANMLVDLGHCGQRTTREAIERSKRPVAITHSGCAALTDSPRNKRDDDLRALAERGGVFGVYVMPYLRAQGQVMAEDVIRHLEHALDVCGEDHVGIGTDGFTSPTAVTDQFRKDFAQQIALRKQRGISAPGENPDSYTFAPDLNTPLRFERIAALLSARGHSDARIEKVLGGNFARLFREVIV